jgi:hypothetical protein
MNTAFPFGFPAPTALYLTAYVVGLALHVAFMSYTLAGAGYLAFSALFGRGRSQTPGSISATIQDWLPFSLGLAITAGVAPLLFLQILYEQFFYSANLLLFHRWMMIVPVLILGFYLLYVLKSDLGKRKGWVWRLSAAGAFACFIFIAWSWTENHLLSRDQSQWVSFYQSEQRFYRSSETIPRLLVWISAAVSVLATLLGWQLRFYAKAGQAAPGQHATVCRLGISSLVVAAVMVQICGWIAIPDLWTVLLGPLARPYTLMAILGGVLMLAGWTLQARRAESHLPSLACTTLGMVLALIGSGVGREVMRLQRIDIGALGAAHERALGAGGFAAFLLLLVVNAALTAWAISIGVEAARDPDLKQWPQSR